MIKLRTLALALFALAGGALAGGYQSSQDVTVSVDSSLTQSLSSTISLLGWTAFTTQEGAHSTVTSLTGITVNHYYVWVCTNGACVPVDPFKVSN